MKSLSIGEVARLVGLHHTTLRQWERKGLIPAPTRDSGSGWRVWTLEEAKAIKRLAKAIKGENRNKARQIAQEARAVGLGQARQRQEAAGAASEAALLAQERESEE
jgi:DNA-binding transcriptional MerR regulator